jgi:hypothetical protein
MRIVFIAKAPISKEMLPSLIDNRANDVAVTKSDFNADHFDLSKMAVDGGIPFRYSNNIITIRPLDVYRGASVRVRCVDAFQLINLSTK